LQTVQTLNYRGAYTKWWRRFPIARQSAIHQPSCSKKSRSHRTLLNGSY